MKVLKVTAEHVTPWSLAYELALATEGKVPTKSPDAVWISKMLMAEHSPIRAKLYKIRIENVPMWVTTHLVRHKIGAEHFVHTQREDRRDIGVPRNELPQGALNDMTMLVNAQAIINISRKRLCNKASAETQEVWRAVYRAVKVIDPLMASYMRAECTYRGSCPEIRPCFKTKKDGKSNRP